MMLQDALAGGRKKQPTAVQAIASVGIHGDDPFLLMME